MVNLQSNQEIIYLLMYVEPKWKKHPPTGGGAGEPYH